MEAKRNPYAKYHPDDEVMKQGIVYEDENMRIKVTFAGSENSRYERMLKLKLKPYDTRIKNDQFSDPEFFKVLAEVYAATVILDWQVLDDNGNWVQGVYDLEGNIIQFNEFAVVQAFNAGQRLFQDIIKLATNFNLFRKNEKEEDAKNL